MSSESDPVYGELSLFEQIALLPDEERNKILRSLTDDDLASARLWLRPKQLRAVDSESWITFVQAGRGYGKRLDVDTPIPTPTGWTRMGDLQDGDEVFDEHGTVCKVIQAHDSVIAEAVELELTGGVKIVADWEHQWKTLTAAERKTFKRKFGTRTPVDWVSLVPERTTKEIVETLTYGKRLDLNHFVPTADPLQLPPADLPIDPWLMGFWLAEGAATTLCTNSDDLEHVLEQVCLAGETISAVKPDPRNKSVGVYLTGMTSRLRALGFEPRTVRSGTKFIPSVYLRGSENQRLALLQGLMDGDGCRSSQTGTSGKAVSHFVYGTTSARLCGDVAELLSSLGAKAFTRSKRATINGKDYGLAYEVSFRPIKGAIRPSRLHRRQFVDDESIAQVDRHLARTIVGYEVVGLREMRCITVDSPSAMYLCSRAMVPTHNTRVGAHWIIEKAKVPGTRIALLGRTVSDVRDVMISGQSGILACSPDSFMPEYLPSVRRLVWPNGSIAQTYSSESPGQLRGPQQHVAWVDELAACKQVPDNSGLTAWDNLQIATRLGDKPQILATTTPKRTQVIRDLVRESREDPDRVLLINGSTLENKANLSREYIQQIYDRYAGTALEKQELHGEFVDEVEGALWRESDFIEVPLPVDHELSTLSIVAVDPGVTTGGDATGIVVVKTTLERKLDKRRIWVVEDATTEGPPEVWSKKVIEMQAKWSTPSHKAIIVAEKNQGGELIRTVLMQIDPSIRLALISAVKSKAARADPVVLAYRQGRVSHAAMLSDLEQEQLDWEEDARWSPNRMDALVHAVRSSIVDPRPLARFSPLIVGELNASVVLATGSPSYRPGRGNSLSIAPWRQGQSSPFGRR